MLFKVWDRAWGCHLCTSYSRPSPVRIKTDFSWWPLKDVQLSFLAPPSAKPKRRIVHSNWKWSPAWKWDSSWAYSKIRVWKLLFSKVTNKGILTVPSDLWPTSFFMRMDDDKEFKQLSSLFRCHSLLLNSHRELASGDPLNTEGLHKGWSPTLYRWTIWDPERLNCSPGHKPDSSIARMGTELFWLQAPALFS